MLTGIDVLERDNFKPLAGMRIGLVTNHTGAIARAADDRCAQQGAGRETGRTLFSRARNSRPRRRKGFRFKRRETGLPIYSLYGETRRPKPEQLKDLDALVFDIQDIGARFYTYISTLGYLMEEAAKAKLPVFVLDRPNPIGGIDVEGPIADGDKLSFISYHTIPMRHGSDDRRVGPAL